MKFWDGKTRYKYLHVKRDGISVEVIGETALTRGGQVLDLKFIEDKLIPGKAELWYPGKPASHVKTALIDRDPELILDYFESKELAWDAELVDVRRYFVDLGKNFIQFFDFYDGFYSKPLQKNQEGWILKDSNRSRCVKWKPHFDLDLIVKGFVPGEGKYRRTLGAMIAGTIDGKLITKVSGMSDKARHFIWENKNEILGKVIEVRHNGILSKGGLRHPRFIRFRDDKLAEDCTC